MPVAPTLLTDYSCAISRHSAALWCTEELFTSAEPIKFPCFGTSGHDCTSRNGLGNHPSQHHVG